MSARITIAQRTNILSKPISAMIALKKIGINYFAKCPFCNDPNHSFCIPHHEWHWMCFSCSRKGGLAEFHAFLGTKNQTQIFKQQILI